MQETERTSFWKRGLAAPLLILAAALAAKGSVDASPSVWTASLLALALSTALLGFRRFEWNPTGIAVASLAGWMIVSNQWLSASYTPAALYHAAFLATAFALGRTAGRGAARTIFAASIVFACSLAAWALWQAWHGEPRAHAIFETPATLSAVLNMILLPTLLAALCFPRRSSIPVPACIALLFSALIVATSRGGWLVFVLCGLGGIAGILYFRIRVERRAAVTAIVALAAGAFLSLLVTHASKPLPQEGARASQALEYSIVGKEAAQSSTDRLAMYDLALHRLTPAALAIGNGYLSYYYDLEAGREKYPGILPGTSYFVHDDYLQVLLELGVPGLIALVAVVLAPPLLLIAFSRRTREPSQLAPALAIATALASMSLHALVDFPFYVPVCLLFYGLGLGALDSFTRRERRVVESSPGTLRRTFAAVLSAVALWFVLSPVVAERAAAHARGEWLAARGEKAAYWFEVARRFQPRDWRYHWYAGQFWFAQGLNNRSREAARLSDEAFSAGYAANKREARNLIGLLEVHRILRALLAAPAEPKVMLRWADRAVELAPSNPIALAERALVAEQFSASGPR